MILKKRCPRCQMRSLSRDPQDDEVVCFACGFRSTYRFDKTGELVFARRDTLPLLSARARMF